MNFNRSNNGVKRDATDNLYNKNVDRKGDLLIVEFSRSLVTGDDQDIVISTNDPIQLVSLTCFDDQV
jgi:hypothetical protein